MLYQTKKEEIIPKKEKRGNLKQARRKVDKIQEKLKQQEKTYWSLRQRKSYLIRQRTFILIQGGNKILFLTHTKTNNTKKISNKKQVKKRHIRILE